MIINVSSAIYLFEGGGGALALKRIYKTTTTSLLNRNIV